MQPYLYIRKNVVELFLIILCTMGTIGTQPNYVALALLVLVCILLLSQQQYLGISLGGLIGFIGLYLSLALLSDAVKIEDYSTIKSIKFIGIGALLCLSLIGSGALLIKKYIPKNT